MHISAYDCYAPCAHQDIYQCNYYANLNTASIWFGHLRME